MNIEKTSNTEPGLHDRDWYMRPVFVNHHDFDYLIFDTACGNPTYGPAIEWTKSSFRTEDDAKVENLKNNKAKIWGNMVESTLNFFMSSTIQLAPIHFHARPTDEEYEWMNLYDSLKYDIAAKYNYSDATIYFYIMWHDIHKKERISDENFKVGDTIKITYYRGNMGMDSNVIDLRRWLYRKYLKKHKSQGVLGHLDSVEYSFIKDCAGKDVYTYMNRMCDSKYRWSYEKVNGKHTINVISITPGILDGGQRGASTRSFLLSGTFLDFCKSLGAIVIQGAFSVRTLTYD